MLMERNVKAEHVATSQAMVEVRVRNPLRSLRVPSPLRAQVRRSHPRRKNLQAAHPALLPALLQALLQAHPQANLQASLIATQRVQRKSLRSGSNGLSTTVPGTPSPATTTVTGIHATATASANGYPSTASLTTCRRFMTSLRRSGTVRSTHSMARTGMIRSKLCASISARSSVKISKPLLAWAMLRPVSSSTNTGGRKFTRASSMLTTLTLSVQPAGWLTRTTS